MNESLELFKKHGINYVTMDSIAANLGISKKTLYNSFQSKEELLSDCLESYLKSRREHNITLVETAGNVIEGMVALLGHAIREISRFNPIFFDELSRYFPQLSRDLIDKQWEKDYDDLSKLMQQGKSQGMILESIHDDILTKALIAQSELISNRDLFPIDRYARTDLFQQIYFTFIRGIATPEGHSILNDVMESQKYSELQP